VGVLLTDSGTAGNAVAGNYVGTNGAGTDPLPNGVGVRIAGSASGNTIGGTTIGERNLISGNTSVGVEISDAGTTGNTLAGNPIGGTSTGARNVVSGNLYGVLIGGLGTDHNTVSGNRIGTNAAASAALANTFGVFVGSGAAGNTVGGTSTAARNLISGNTTG